MKASLNFIFLLCFFYCVAQQKNNSNYLQVAYSYGSLLAPKGVNHLLTGNPESVLFSWNNRTHGEKDWHQLFNYPDIGYSFIYQDLKNENLGKIYGIYGHYNFYFFDRKLDNNLIFTIGTGIAYITNPYHKIYNNKNIVIGSHINSSSYIRLVYSKENIIDKIGLQAGFSFLHASNASTKAPNKGINVWGLNLGINYNLEKNSIPYKTTIDTKTYKQPIHFNLVTYAGFNESDHIDSGKFPFVIFSAFLDKRLNRKNALQLGTEIHFHSAIKESNTFYYIFNGDVTNNNHHDWKRLSVFLGYELFVNKTSIFAQLGYYVYAPSIQETMIYERIGMKRYLNEKFYASLSVKAHLVDAEALEFGFGYRF